MKKHLLALYLCFAACVPALLGQTTAGPTVRFHTNLGDIDVQLLPEAAPNTVANFLGYVDRGDYNNSFIHRAIPGFVIQGGGYRYSNLNVMTIPALDPVANEFNVSNTRGTIAMAKLGGKPDSATDEWFFNLADNSANLDNQNGGFTVFGRITNDQGLAVVDTIAAQPKLNIGAPFDQVPVVNYTSGSTLLESNLVEVLSITRLVLSPSVVSVVGMPSSGGFVVSRNGSSLDQPVTVLFHNGGSAVRDQDYVAFPGSVTIPSGQSESVIPVTLLPGANRNHKVKVFLDADPNGGSSYTISKFQSKVFLSDLP